MSTTPVICPMCGRKLRVDTRKVGSRGKCPACGETIDLRPDEPGPEQSPGFPVMHDPIVFEGLHSEDYNTEPGKSKPLLSQFSELWKWGVLVMLIITGIAIYSSESEDESERSESLRPTDVANANEEELRFLAQEASWIVQNKVLDSLRAPSTAEFSDTFTFESWPIKWPVEERNSRTFDLEMHVEAKNSFGVPLRDKISANLTYDGNTKKWDIFYLTLGDSYIVKDPEMVKLEKLMADCREVERFTGSGDRTTSAFTIYAPEFWRFRVTCKFNAKTDDVDSKVIAEVIDSSGRVVTISPELTWSETRLIVVDERGTFRIRIKAIGKWEVIVEEPI